MSYEKVVALYDTEAGANAALKSLISAGYLTDDISVIRNERDAEKAGLYEPGIWQRLFGRDLEHHEAAVLGRSLKEGSVIVSVRVPETEAPKVLSLLDTHQPVDIVDRAKAYDFKGATAGIAATAGTAATAGMATMAAASKLPGEEMLRVAEEQINVGKRIVEAGHTRVRRFVVDKPVEAKITLHEEHAEVIRRAISDPAYVRDVDWSEKTIDVTETAEEAVVNKTVRFTEEIVIRKQGSDSTRTVHDTVRSQRVEVDHLPVGAGKK
jgi:stress response protein YsnF